MESRTFRKTAFIHHTKEIINIKTNLHTGYLRKVAKKRGTQISSKAHIYVAFSVVSTGNQQCSVPQFLASFGTPAIYY